MNLINRANNSEQPLPLISNLPKLLEICIDRLNDAILITEAEPIDKPGPRIVWANKVFYERNGYRPDEVLGQSPRILQGPDTDRATLDRVRVALENWQSIRAETLNYRKDGSTYWNEFEIAPIADEKGWFTHWVSVQRDITDRKKIEEQIHQLAFYDSLTKLANRTLLRDRLKHAIAISKRSKGHGALMFIDLDNFKPVNDTYGHAAGDLLLIEAANRLTSCVREVDTVSRFGGDEFVVLLNELDIDESKVTPLVKQIAEKILLSLSLPYTLSLAQEGSATRLVEHHCTASIGVTIFNHHGNNVDEVLKSADAAMYQAKESGRNSIRFYDQVLPF